MQHAKRSLTVRPAGPPTVKRVVRGADVQSVPRKDRPMTTDYRRLAIVIALTKRKLGLS